MPCGNPKAMRPERDPVRVLTKGQLQGESGCCSGDTRWNVVGRSVLVELPVSMLRGHGIATCPSVAHWNWPILSTVLEDSV